MLGALAVLPVVGIPAAAAAIPTAAPAMDFPLAVAPSIPVDDLKLIELAEQLKAAVDESRRLNLIAEDLQSAYRMSELPEALRVRPSDAENGRTTWESTDEFWHRPCDIDKWRNIVKYEREIEETADGFVMTIREIEPAAELRERAEEIVSAYDRWDAEHQNPPGYKAAKLAYHKAERIETRLEERIYAIRATTIAGMIAKARVAELYFFESGIRGCFMSIAEDLLALNAESPTRPSTPIKIAPPALLSNGRKG